MESSMEASETVVNGVFSYFVLLSLFQTIQTQRRLNDIRVLMERRRMEFVAEMAKSPRSYRQRREAFVAFMVAIVDGVAPTVRRMCVRDRAHGFWSTIEHSDDDQWKAHF